MIKHNHRSVFSSFGLLARRMRRPTEFLRADRQGLPVVLGTANVSSRAGNRSSIYFELGRCTLTRATDSVRGWLLAGFRGGQIGESVKRRCALSLCVGVVPGNHEHVPIHLNVSRLAFDFSDAACRERCVAALQRLAEHPQFLEAIRQLERHIVTSPT